jgi:hypothetical protein
MRKLDVSALALSVLVFGCSASVDASGQREQSSAIPSAGSYSSPIGGTGGEPLTQSGGSGSAAGASGGAPGASAGVGGSGGAQSPGAAGAVNVWGGGASFAGSASGGASGASAGASQTEGGAGVGGQAGDPLAPYAGCNGFTNYAVPNGTCMKFVGRFIGGDFRGIECDPNTTFNSIQTCGTVTASADGVVANVRAQDGYSYTATRFDGPCPVPCTN